jgi:hypothetical protein
VGSNNKARIRKKMAIWQRPNYRLENRQRHQICNRMGRQNLRTMGEVLEVIPNKLAKYSLFAPRLDLEDKPENYFVMSYILSDENGTTKLEIVQEDNRPGAVQEAPQGEENPMLAGLKALIEAS